MKIVKKVNGEAVFPYIAYIPENVSDHPALLVQLHGAGERGSGGEETELVLIHGFCNTATDENMKDCILIMPQCPKDSFWAAKVESIKKLIDDMIAEYSADTGRIYLCGLSMGGYGTWYTAMAYPDLFAAIAPCCGGGMAWNAGVLTMPVWAFHGLEDTVVSPVQTIEMVEQLKALGRDVRCSLYEGVGHGSWALAFTEPTLRWLLEQKKH